MQTELQLTKQQRHRVYSHVLYEIKEEPDYCICPCLECAIDELFKIDLDTMLGFQPVLDEFPEFAKHEPEVKFAYDRWFPDNDEGHKQRIAVLEQCVEETREVVNG